MRIALYIVAHFLEREPLSTEIFRPIVVGDGVGLELANDASYAEMRAQFQCWRTELSGLDWIGFQHYRRYLTLPPRRFLSYIEVFEQYDLERFGRYRAQLAQLSPDDLKPLLDGCDVYTTTPWPWDVRQQFADYHGSRAARTLTASLPERWRGDVVGFYPGNMYLMRAEVFDAYMKVWHRVISDFAEAYGPVAIADSGNATRNERLAGCASERVFSYWIADQLASNPRFRLMTCPHVFCPEYKQ